MMFLFCPKKKLTFLLCYLFGDSSFAFASPAKQQQGLLGFCSSAKKISKWMFCGADDDDDGGGTTAWENGSRLKE